jgi:hypothetical protein
MSARAFVVGVGGLLVIVGAVLLVMHNLDVLQTCTTTTNYYDAVETCTQSPALLIAGIVLAVIGLVAAVGGVVVGT